MNSKWWRIIHVVIIVNFILGIGYGFYMVFFAIGGETRPLFGGALDIPKEIFIRRRLYAMETWIAIAGLGIYLGVTEILPRKIKAQS